MKSEMQILRVSLVGQHYNRTLNNKIKLDSIRGGRDSPGDFQKIFTFLQFYWNENGCKRAVEVQIIAIKLQGQASTTFLSKSCESPFQ